MRFGVLGEVVASGDLTTALGPYKQRVVFAVLLAKRGSVASVDELVDAVWGDRPPKTAIKNLQVYVHHLRQLLDDPSRISRQPSGYRLRVEPGELDADRFEELLAEAAGREPAVAAGLLRRALALWRGPAYDGMADIVVLRDAAERLEDRRLAAVESRIAADLDLGRHPEVIDELATLVERWPWRERFVGQLMRALHQSGRSSQALAAYERGRRAMADELGIDPGPELRRLFREIRAGQPGSRTGVPTPAQLPADVADFAGRDKEVASAIGALDPSGGGSSVVTISGPAGVGKTALAIRIGHRLRQECPDGQLYVSLAGAQGRPADPGAVLAGFLRALGIQPAAIPDSRSERAALYRSLLSDRRMLVVLDSAADQAQIESLLPGTPSCRVLVTSRIRMAGLPGGYPIDLAPLDLSDSLHLIGQMVGAQRLGTQGDAADELAQLCGGLPLALRVAGAKLAARAHWSLRDLVERLADEHRRLDELRYRELEVRASFALSYQGLTGPAATLFRRLGCLDAPDVAGWVAAALLDCPVGTAEPLLEELVDTRLLEVAGRDPVGQHRYRFHDLLRVYARERARDEDSEQERTEALSRAFAAWLALMDRAHGAVFGDGSSKYATRWEPSDAWPDLLLDASLGWPDAERGNLMAAVRQAADLGLAELCWELAALAIEEFAAFDDVEDWRDTGTYALAAMRRLGHRRGQAAIGLQLGALHAARRRYGQGSAEIERAYELFTEIDDRHGIGLALRHRGILAMAGGDLAGAEEALGLARDLLHDSGDGGAEAHALIYLGRIAGHRGEVDEALEQLAAAGELARAAHAEKLLYEATFWTGQTQLKYHLDGAADTLHSAADQLLRLGAQVADTYGLYARGDGNLAAGRLAEASVAYAESLAVARRQRDVVMQARVLHRTGQLALNRGDNTEAMRLLTESVRLTAQASPLDRAYLLDTAGDACRAAGQDAQATAYWRESADIFGRLGLPDADRVAAKS